jgi:hypothetical protein
MTESLLTTGPEQPASPAPEPPPIVAEPKPLRPAGVPTKFWDEEKAALRTEALIKSYLELEKKLSSARFPELPKSPEDYQIKIGNDVIAVDPDLNRRLYEAGFNQEQTQLVYDLASERLMPLVAEIAAVFEAEAQVARLVKHFGSEQRWHGTARQIETWGRAHLPERVFEALSTTYEGVLAMHRMMSHSEPDLVKDVGAVNQDVSEGDLRRLMRDPAYWRDQRPEIVEEVRAGFKRLYRDQG